MSRSRYGAARDRRGRLQQGDRLAGRLPRGRCARCPGGPGPGTLRRCQPAPKLVGEPGALFAAGRSSTGSAAHRAWTAGCRRASHGPRAARHGAARDRGRRLPAPKVVRRVTSFCRPAVTRPRRIPVGPVGRVDESRITRTGGESGDGDTGPALSAHESRDSKPALGQGPIEDLAGDRRATPPLPRPRVSSLRQCHSAPLGLRR